MPTRILLLADINSVHTQKWAIGLAQKGFSIGIFSLNGTASKWFDSHDNIECVHMPDSQTGSGSLFSKLGYLTQLPLLLMKIRTFKPDIVHAHYASSYGLLGALSGFSPFIISAWGTDVMRFPKKNGICSEILKFSLKRADMICATSHTLESSIQRLVNKKVEVVPFGVDLNEFKRGSKAEAKKEFRIGCVKALEKIYNISSLIIAFSYLRQKYSTKNLKLDIVGDGSERANLEDLARRLKLEDAVTFKGTLKHAEIPATLNTFDVFVNLSEYESFGVSVVEAMACQTPVVVSNAEGLKEVVDNRDCGHMVAPFNIGQIVDAIENYLVDEHLRQSVSGNAFHRVKVHYNWENNLGQMVSLYHRFTRPKEIYNSTLEAA
ncbi:MAG: glycosyltransferase [Bacteroidia bacterium]